MGLFFWVFFFYRLPFFSPRPVWMYVIFSYKDKCMPYNLFIWKFIFVVYIVVVKLFDRSIFLKSLYVMLPLFWFFFFVCLLILWEHNGDIKSLRCTLSLLTCSQTAKVPFYSVTIEQSERTLIKLCSGIVKS